MSIGDEKYVSLTTFTSDGREKSTPVWIANLPDGRVGFTTEPASWKVRRISRDSKVRLQPCDMRGRINAGTAPVNGTAEVLSEDSDRYAQVRKALDSKYGLTAKAVQLQSRAMSLLKRSEPERCAVVIELS